MARHARRLIVWTTGVLLSLALLAMLGLALLVWGIDPDLFRGRIAQAASEALGRRVELTGPLKWRPGLELQLESLGGRIDNAPGFGDSPLASWKALRLGVALRPLLDRQVVIDGLELQGLDLHLARAATGVNWQFPAMGNAPSDPGYRLSLGRIRLRDAAVEYRDAISGKAWSASKVMLDVKLPPSLDVPSLRFPGIWLAAILRGPPLQGPGATIQLRIPMLDMDRAAGHWHVPAWELQWDEARASGGFDAALGGAPSLHGNLQVEMPSLRRLMQSASIDLPATRDAAVFGPLKARFGFDGSPAALSITGLDATLDATRITGSARAAALQPLSLRFELAADAMDLDRYLAPDDAPGTPLRLPLAQLRALDAKGVFTLRRATLAGATARQMRIDVD